MKKILSSPLFHKTLGLLVSVGLLGWIGFTTDWREVLVAFQGASLWPLLPSLALLTLHVMIRSYRWKFLLPERNPPAKFRTLFDALMLGNFATYVLPLRAGEFVRPFLLSRQAGYPYPTAFVSVVIERFFDLVAVLLSFAVVVALLPGIPELLFKGATVLGLIGGALLVFMVFGAALPNQTRAFSHRVFSILPKPIAALGEKITGDVLSGLAVLRSFSTVLKILWWTVLVWGSCYLLFWLFLYFLDLPATPLVGMSVAVILALAVAAPSAPGFLGVYQAGCIMAFALFGVPREPAIAYALITHLIHYFMNIGYGVFLLAKYNLQMKDLGKQQEPAAA